MGRWILLVLSVLATKSWADSSLPAPSPGFGKTRKGASRTRLPDGRMLIAGGFFYNPGLDADWQVATVELYDPRTRRFARAEEMHDPRADHLATLLRDGRVLVTGGCIGDGECEFAEVWDPRSGRWTRIEMPVYFNVNEHTVTLLADGRALIVGGRMNPECPSTRHESFLFDPTTNQMAASGELAGERSEHAAVLLTDGRVLVAGGEYLERSRWCDDRQTSERPEAEVWDPGTGKWSAAGTPGDWRREPFSLSALSDGGALLKGGKAYPDYRDLANEHCLFEPHGCARRAHTERWDPSTRTWHWVKR